MSARARVLPHPGYGLALTFLALAVWFQVRAERQAHARADRFEDTLRTVNDRAETSDAALGHASARLAELEASTAERADLVQALSAERDTLRDALWAARFEKARRAYAEGRLDVVRDILDAEPPERRHWEWGWLDRRLAGGARSLSGPDQPAANLAAHPAGDGLVLATDEGVVHVVRVGSGPPEVGPVLFDAGEPLAALAALPGSGPVAEPDERDRPSLVTASDFGLLTLVPSDPTRAPITLELEERVGALVAARDDGGRPQVFVGTVEGRILRWSPESAELVPLGAHEDVVTALALSPDGRWIASASDDSSVRWMRLDERAGGTVSDSSRHDLHDDWTRAVAFDAAGRRLASCGDDGRLFVVELETGRAALAGELDAALVLVGFDAEAEPFALADDGRLLEPRLGVTRSVPLAPGGIVVSAAEGDAGGAPWIAFADGESSAQLVQAESDAALPAPRLRVEFENAVRSIALSPDGGRAAAGFADGTLVWLDTRTGTVTSPIDPAHGRMTRSLAFSADGRTLASGAASGEVLVWDLESGRRSADFGFDERVEALAFTDDGLTLVVALGSGAGARIDRTSGEVTPRDLRPTGYVFDGLVSPGAATSGWIGDAGTIRLWDVRSGERVSALRLRAAGQVESAAVDRAVRRIGLISNTTAALVVDAASGAVLAQLYDTAFGFRALALSEDGQRMAVVAGDGTLRVVGAGDGSLLFEVAGTGDPALAVAFSADGHTLVVGDAKGGVSVW